MLLRRVIEHFRKQEWTAIAIDFVIVVVGVFIGLQVANWNEARADQVRADAYLERVRDDLDADIVSFADRLSFWNTVADYGRSSLGYAEGQRTGQAQWETLLAYYQASQVAEFSTIDTTWRELTAAGELDLIRNLALRNELSLYYATATNPVLSERPAYREHVRGIVPLDVQDYIWDRCYSTDATRGVQELTACASPISEAKSAQIVAEISRNHSLMAELRYWMSTMRVATIIGEDRAASAAALRASINAELSGD